MKQKFKIMKQFTGKQVFFPQLKMITRHMCSDNKKNHVQNWFRERLIYFWNLFDSVTLLKKFSEVDNITDCFTESTAWLLMIWWWQRTGHGNNHWKQRVHDDVIKWKHFPRNWPFVRGIHRSPAVTWSFDVFFDLRLNKRLSKQSWGWWFETLSCPLWRHCNAKRCHDVHFVIQPRSYCLSARSEMKPSHIQLMKFL